MRDMTLIDCLDLPGELPGIQSGHPDHISTMHCNINEAYELILFLCSEAVLYRTDSIKSCQLR